MKKITMLSLGLCLAFSTLLSAQDTRMTPGIPTSTKGMKSYKPAGQDDKSSMHDSQECEGDECPIMAKAMESLPKMVFRVGTEETQCHMTATRLAHDAHEKIVYVVGKKRFNISEDAFKSLVKQTEGYVKKYVSPKVCKEDGSTTLAGETCDCPVAASKMTKVIQKATQDVKLTYSVGEKMFDKYNDAKRRARKTQMRGMYVVGDEKFENEYEARLALALKKYRSAVAAVRDLKTAQTKDAADAVETTKSTGTDTKSAAIEG